MKVYVYAICKNESAFIPRWMDSMGEADGIFVLDTGSEDGSPALLRERGAVVREESITPWRFDTARNRALELVPEDGEICVSTDLDEVFRPGWRRAMEASWKPGTGRLSYRYTWSFRPDGSEGVVFYIEKAHSRHGWKWVHPVHEVLSPVGAAGPSLRAAGVQLCHYPDGSKSRSQYLPLLELSVREDPEDDRNMHYLGREYLYYGRWEECISTLRRHLALRRALWRDERCASMRYIARAEEARGNIAGAEEWYLRSSAEAPYLREPWVELGAYLYRRRDWCGGLWAMERALSIRNRPETYICEERAWGSLPWDLGALCAWELGMRERAEKLGERAAELEPENVRLRENLRCYRGEEKV